MSSNNSIYVRVKRQNQTYFIMCEPENKISYVKEQISMASKGEHSAESMQLLSKDRSVLENDNTVATYEIKNEDMLYVVFQVSENEWEPVQVVEDPTATGGDP